MGIVGSCSGQGRALLRRAPAATAICLAVLAASASAQQRSGSISDCRSLDADSPRETVRRCTAAMRAGELGSNDLLQAYIAGGDERYRRSDYRGAIAGYSLALRLDARHAETLYRRGNAFYMSGDYRPSLADYELALQVIPNHLGYLVARANARYMLHDYSGALADYSRAIELNPVFPEAYVGRGNVHSVRHDYVRALADYDAALRTPSRDANAYYARGAARMGQRDWENALIDLNRSIDLNPRSAIAFARRARAHVGLGNRAWAEADFREAEQLAQGDASALNSLCWNLALAGEDLARARAHCDASLVIDPDNVDTLHTRALVSLRQGGFRAALADFNRALPRDRANPELIYGRGLTMLRLGRVRQGRADIARALAIEPGIAQVYAAEYGVMPDG